MKKRILLLFCCLVFVPICYGQETNPRAERKFGFGGQLLGPTLILSANLNYFITHNFNIEIGAGAIGYYGGLKYYMGKADKQHTWTPYVGANFTSVTFFKISLKGNSSNDQKNGLYAPVGIQLMTSKGFTFAPEIAYLYLGGSEKPPFGEQ